MSNRTIALAAGACAVVFPIAFRGSTYPLFVASEFAIFAIVALSLDLLLGRSGQLSLGQSGFVAIGAYAAALLNARFGLDLLIGIGTAAVLAGVASLIVGLPATRLRGHYLAIVTFGFSLSIAQIALKWSALTGGDEGVRLAHPVLAGIPIDSPIRAYVLAFAALTAVAALQYALLRTALGRSFAAVRDSETAAAAIGINVAQTKVVAFAIAAALAGVAGALEASLTGFVAPENFGVMQTLAFFSMVVLGGTATIPGTIAGAFVVEAVTQTAATIGGLSLTILGAAIVLTALFVPEGLGAIFVRLARSRARGAARVFTRELPADGAP
ncbi:MAG: branched-chain amino acid ABC transporter permease [Candidatus Velthaea sp.]